MTANPQPALAAPDVPQPERPNIWYKPVKQTDYQALSQIGEVVFRLRLLPSIENNMLMEGLGEKDVSTSPFPNSKKWLVPVMVQEDPLHPEMNGFVGVMEITKTLYNRIKNNATPQNYFAFDNGYTFNVVVSLQQSKDGQSWFPNYTKSCYDQQPSAIDYNYPITKLREYKIENFSEFVQRLNDGILRKAQGGVPGNTAMVNPQATAAPTVYGTEPVAAVAPVPVAPVAPVAAAPVAVAPAPVVAPSSAPAVAPVPAGPPAVAPAPVAPTAPAAPAAPPVNSSVPWDEAPDVPTPDAQPQDFDSIFGTPEG